MAGRMGRNEQKEHTYRKFGSDLRSDGLADVLFMYGEEQYLVEWAVKQALDKYVQPAMRSFDFVKLDDETTSVDEIICACDSFPLSSEKKLVCIKNHLLTRMSNPKDFTAEDKEKLISYIADPNRGNLLIFTCDEPDEKSDVVKALKKCAAVYNFDRLDYAQLSAFAEKRFRSVGMSIGRDMLRYLIDETGYFNKETEYRIYNLENDIKKIIAYCDSDTVSREDIAATMNGDADTFIFNFLDAAARRKKETAYELMHNILSSGSDVFAITAMLINQFELLLDVSEFKEDSLSLTEIVSTMKAHEFRVKKAMQLADKFTKQKLKEILCQLYETDRNIKNGLLEPTLALELLVGRI